MATHDYIISNASGASVRADLNNALAAIVSNNSNATSPATTYAYQWWADTTTGQLKLRNSANSAWITIFELDGTMLMEDGTVSAPGLAFASDLNTGFFRSAADKINFATGGAERLEIGSSEVVFNDPSNDVDFRVESNGNTHMLFVDAGNDRVGVGASSPSTPLTVQSDSGTNSIAVLGRSADDISSTLFFENDGTTQIGRLQARQSYFQISGTNNSKGIYIDNSGNIGIGTSGPAGILHTSGSSDQTVTIQTTTSGADSRINFRNNGGADAGGIHYKHNGNALAFNTGGSNAEAARIDSSGRLLVGGTSAISGSAANDNLQLINSAGSILSVASSDTTISQGTRIGEIEFWGQPGSTWGHFASISVKGDGSAAANDNPGNIQFATTADSASTPTERVRINSDGNMGLGETSPDTRLHIKESTTGATGIFIQNSNGATNSSADLYFGNWNGSSTTTPQARFSAINTNVSTAKTDLAISIYDGNNTLERARIDGDGRLLVGTSSSKESLSNIQCVRSSESTLSIFTSDTSASEKAKINLGPSNNITGAQIICDAEEDFSTGANRTGRLSFTTRKDGTIVERVRITSDGYLKASNNGTYISTASYHEFNQSNNEQMLFSKASHASFSENMIVLRATRSNTSAYNFFLCQSNNGTDSEFILRGDGNGYADGSWNGGGADYAEFFEWSDSNANAEDRRGISVVLDGDKIREAIAGEEPIGVISGNPSVVGDADIDRWKGKYLRDDYGTYIQEDYEVEDDDGNTVVQQRRKLNPDYDPDTEYVTRENRPEWDTVGLMGKLRIRKGQVTGTRWIKMRDVSDTVEEWLVR